VGVRIVVWVAGSTLLLLEGGERGGGGSNPGERGGGGSNPGGGTSHQHKIGRATKTSDANVPQLRS
jgi:hypothetical protein